MDTILPVTEAAHIESLSEFMEYVENLPEGFDLSRGQNRDLPLLPVGKD
ncbi:hypothetical protein M3699_22580 [Peribacillus simplex]|nr:hypothetical protein [Peribacillus simplex]MCM3676557.1 hypothetical protein [Peribacillus simplex]